MRYFGFKISLALLVTLFVFANVWDQRTQQEAYFRMLVEKDLVWGGAWSWGFPFDMVFQGAGLNGVEWALIPFGLLVNVILLAATVMLFGVAIEMLLDRARAKINS